MHLSGYTQNQFFFFIIGFIIIITRTYKIRDTKLSRAMKVTFPTSAGITILLSNLRPCAVLCCVYHVLSESLGIIDSKRSLKLC